MNYNSLSDKAVLSLAVARFSKIAVAEHLEVLPKQIDVWQSRGLAKHVRPRLMLWLMETDPGSQTAVVVAELQAIHKLMEDFVQHFEWGRDPGLGQPNAAPRKQ